MDERPAIDGGDVDVPDFAGGDSFEGALEIERHLERFLRLGKPVHITELGVSSANEPMPEGEVKNPNRNVWHGAEWSETIQADWAEQFYTICYSKPEIEAITPILIVSSAKAGEAASAIGPMAAAIRRPRPSLTKSRLFMRLSPCDYCPVAAAQRKAHANWRRSSQFPFKPLL